jgi:16S rRNA A1518/A1519 N6-dimethyltransferase RsmA/KsgA/DIM1 with predicted DNA glycosylase/AP lyase activity
VAVRRARSARRHGRARSQHFLRPQIAAEVVRDAAIKPGELVVDIGAGTGRLTAALARAGAHVIAIELDRSLAARLRVRWASVDVVHADATRVELPREPFRVVANIPFDRTTDLFHRLLDDPRTPLVRADLVVEWGVAAKRALGWPSTLNGACWGAWYRFAITRRLLRTSFEPPPAVDAGVLVVERRVDALVPTDEWQRYRGFVAGGFRRGVRSVAPARALRRLGLAGAAPRDLDAHQWAALYRLVSGPSVAASSTAGADDAKHASVGRRKRRSNAGGSADRSSGRVPNGPQ